MPTDVLADLHPDEVESLKEALRTARGQYTAERAAQLAGVPLRTLYHWASEGLLVPDYEGRPMQWSYRDLVFTRLFTWLRSMRVTPPDAASRVQQVRRAIETEGEDIERVRRTSRLFLVGQESYDRHSGEGVLPALLGYLADFSLVAPLNVPELGRNGVWGPNLIRPSQHSAISPWVMSGDPCVRHSRLPTASIFALQEERGLSTADIVELYQGALSADAAQDAISLEHRLRRMPLAA